MFAESTHVCSTCMTVSFWMMLLSGWWPFAISPYLTVWPFTSICIRKLFLVQDRVSCFGGPLPSWHDGRRCCCLWPSWPLGCWHWTRPLSQVPISQLCVVRRLLWLVRCLLRCLLPQHWQLISTQTASARLMRSWSLSPSSLCGLHSWSGIPSSLLLMMSPATATLAKPSMALLRTSLPTTAAALRTAKHAAWPSFSIASGQSACRKRCEVQNFLHLGLFLKESLNLALEVQRRWSCFYVLFIILMDAHFAFYLVHSSKERWTCVNTECIDVWIGKMVNGQKLVRVEASHADILVQFGWLKRKTKTQRSQTSPRQIFRLHFEFLKGGRMWCTEDTVKRYWINVYWTNIIYVYKWIFIYI